MKKFLSALTIGAILSMPLSITEAATPEDDEVQKLLERYSENAKKIAALQKKSSEESEETQPVEEAETEPEETAGEVFYPEDEEIEKIALPEEPPEEKSPPPVQLREEYPETDKLFSFDWRGTPLSQSIYGIAKISGLGVVINAEIGGTVYTSLHDVNCYAALDYLGRAFNFNWMIEDGNIIITKDDKMKQSQTFEVKYANKEKLVAEFKSLGLEETNIYANPESGTISVTGTSWELNQVRKRLREIDKPVSQCLLLAQLIEVSHGKDKNLGMSYSLPTYTHDADSDYSGKLSHKLPFSISVSANREIADGKVIARPMVLMLNGEKGTVNFGDSVPILGETTTSSSTTVTVEYRDVGTNLGVTPVINKELEEITLNVEVEVSNITSWRTSGNTTAPQISTRKATTSAHLKNGESLIIGGLMSEREIKSLSGIPGLMNLPILGELFRARSTSHTYAEVYVMLTPYIVSEGINPQQIMAELKAGDENGNANDKSGRTDNGRLGGKKS